MTFFRWGGDGRSAASWLGVRTIRRAETTLAQLATLAPVGGKICLRRVQRGFQLGLWFSPVGICPGAAAALASPWPEC